MADQSTNPRGVGMTDIQGAIKGILARENPDNQTDEANRPDGEEVKDEAEDQESNADTIDEEEDNDVTDEDESQEDDEDEAKDSGEEGDDDEESDDDSDDSDEPDEKFLERKVKTKDGAEITVQEAVNGYLRQADYTRKTQEVSDIKKHWLGESEQLKQGMELIGTFLSAELQPFENINWDKLKAEDNNEYLVKRNEYQEAVQRLQGVQQSYQQLVQQQQAALQEQVQNKALEETENLKSAFPELTTEKGKVEKTQAWAEYGQQLGFSPQEMSQVIDHRLFVILDKAMQYDALQERRKKASKKKVTRNPKKVNKGNQGDRKLSTEQRQTKEINDRFNQRKDVQSAAEVIKSRMFPKQ